jgi:predicted Zn-dependent protease
MMRVSVPVDVMVREASALARQGRVMEAIDAYLRLLRQRPDPPNSWYNLAVQQRRAGAFREALASYAWAPDFVFDDSSKAMQEAVRREGGSQVFFPRGAQRSRSFVTTGSRSWPRNGLRCDS